MITNRFASGTVLAIAIALFARNRNTLTTSGAVAAVIVAAACVAAGWTWGIILVVFFLGGTTLSHVGRQSKRMATGDIVGKDGPRDAWQVLANGGPFAAAAIAGLVWPSHAWYAFGAGAIAASSADTWATEIGTLSSSAPRSIIRWKHVRPGTSGGVTWLGMWAALSGAALIALVTILADWPGIAICAALVGGFMGSLVDSLLGAALQVKRWCPGCEKMTERVTHVCGTTTDIVGGISWLDNDAVNVLSSVAGGVIGAACLI